MEQSGMDYSKFLEEARLAVIKEAELRKQEEELGVQEAERRQELMAEEQSLKDNIERTVQNRRKELSDNFDDEIARERDAVKRAQSKKERAKSIGKQERIASESAPLEDKRTEIKRTLRELFRKNGVPSIFRSKLYYALYWPQHFAEWMKILLFVAALFVALPCGIYFFALPERLRNIPALVLIYTAIGTRSKLRYLETLKEGRRMQNELTALARELKKLKKRIQRDKSDEPYALDSYDSEISAAEQRLEETQQKKQAAMQKFEAETSGIIAKELSGEAEPRITQKKSAYEETHSRLTEIGKERQAAALRLAEAYEPLLGKEFMSEEKIEALKNIMDNGTATNLAEAVEQYRNRQES